MREGAQMAALTSLQHRNGMIYHEQDDSSSGEFPGPSSRHRLPVGAGDGRASSAGSDKLLQRSSSRTAGSEGSYEEIYSSSEEDSYHSDCDDIAEYWDPYCKAQMHA